MRPVLHGDVVAAARHLLTVPEVLRRQVMRKLIHRAGLADRFRRRFGRCHLLWGDGTLQGVASRRALAGEPYLDDLEYCACMALVFEVLIDRAPVSRGRR